MAQSKPGTLDFVATCGADGQMTWVTSFLPDTGWDANTQYLVAVSRAEYADRIVRGGFPEAVSRTNTRRRQRFHDSYVADLVARDVTQLSEPTGLAV